jgi:hypothetical protein
MSVLNCEAVTFSVQVHRAPPSWTGDLVDESFIVNVPLGFFKPAWGFWTSSKLADGSSEWSRLARRSEGRRELRNFEFEVWGSPRILVLRGDGDVDAVLAHYGGERYGVEDLMEAGDYSPEGMERYSRSMEAFAAAWRAITSDFDAVHVPSIFSRSGALRTWDVESTVWFRPAAFLRKLP